MAEVTGQTGDLVILDCTVRDGNYAIDFKFTEADTRLVVHQLKKLGLTWIEVGHGLGLGAAEAGKVDMPADDCTMIRAAKAAAGDRLIGSFFIPGIGKMEHLEAARDAGLDFVRCGANAPEAEVTFPYITRARELGLIPCLNLMKTYAVSPELFARKARQAVEAGAEIIYVVDSAGGMMCDTVAEYFDATRAAVDCKMGFHGHNNLMLVIANCISAYEHGARFLDASMCGMGRSAGNAPTEILVAVLERMGVRTGVDLFGLLDVVDRYMWPLLSRVRPHDAMAVVAGYSQFHSSYLPQVREAARKHGAELRRLVAKVAFHDQVDVDKAFLEAAAKELADTASVGKSEELVAFNVPGLAPDRISSSMKAVTALIDGLMVTGAKRKGSRLALHLVPTETEEPSLVLSEFVTEDSRAAIGRVTYGSLDVLREVIELASPSVSVFLVSRTQGWASGALDTVRNIVGPGRAHSVQDEELRASFLADVLERATERAGRNSVLIYAPDPLIWRAIERCGNWGDLFVLKGTEPPESAAVRAVVFTGWQDWRELNLQFRLVVCGASPSASDASMLARTLHPEARVLSVEPVPSRAIAEAVGDRLLHVDMNRAYAGLVERILAADALFGPAQWIPGDTED